MRTIEPTDMGKDAGEDMDFGTSDRVNKNPVPTVVVFEERAKQAQTSVQNEITILCSTISHIDTNSFDLGFRNWEVWLD